MTAGRFAGEEQGASLNVLPRVCVNDEALIFRAGRICPESLLHEAWANEWRDLSHYCRFIAKNYATRWPAGGPREALWIVDNLTCGNYHHWVIDSLPRLVRAERLYPDADTLVLPESFRRDQFVAFTLQAFPRFRVRWIGRRERLRVGRLQFVHYTPAAAFGGAPSYRPELIGTVAQRVGALVPGGGEPLRLYYTRADAGRRRARNERDVIRVLEGSGFQVVKGGGSDPAQQVALSRRAVAIAGVHGAALTNMIFMPRGGSVIEFRGVVEPGIYTPENYRVLAEAAGLAYTMLPCELTEPVSGWNSNHSDIIVDLDRLRESLDAIDLADKARGGQDE